MTCPCGSQRAYDDCCGPYISGSGNPPTAEALMRSRYTAFTHGFFDYIGKTFALRSQAEAHAEGARQWAASGSFKRLKVVSTTEGGENHRRGLVEFVATYVQDGETWDHHEVSRFERDANGHWAYAGGDGHRHREGQVHHDHHHLHQHGGQTVRHDQPKTGRNDPCPCGSGKKFKKCCGA
jgi:SEC-C motif domain protein